MIDRDSFFWVVAGVLLFIVLTILGMLAYGHLMGLYEPPLIIQPQLGA